MVIWTAQSSRQSAQSPAKDNRRVRPEWTQAVFRLRSMFWNTPRPATDAASRRLGIRAISLGTRRLERAREAERRRSWPQRSAFQGPCAAFGTLAERHCHSSVSPRDSHLPYRHTHRVCGVSLLRAFQAVFQSLERARSPSRRHSSHVRSNECSSLWNTRNAHDAARPFGPFCWLAARSRPYSSRRISRRPQPFGDLYRLGHIGLCPVPDRTHRLRAMLGPIRGVYTGGPQAAIYIGHAPGDPPDVIFKYPNI